MQRQRLKTQHENDKLNAFLILCEVEMYMVPLLTGGMSHLYRQKNASICPETGVV